MVFNESIMATALIVDPKKALNRELITVGIGILILGSIILFLGYRVSATAEAINAMRVDATTKTAKLGTLSKLERQYAIVSPYIPKLQSVLPKRDEMITFDRTLIALAAQQGVGFGFSFGGETAADATNAGSVRFTITLQGALADVTNYLDALHKLPYFIEFPEIDTAISGGQYSMRLDGRVFNR